MINADTLTVRLEHRIENIDAGAWNQLAADDVYAQHGWLRVLETAVPEASNPVYFLLCEGGNVIGAAICYRFDEAAPSSLDEMLLGRLCGPFARLGISLRPALLCGPLIGQGRHVLWRRDMEAPELDRLLERLLDAISTFVANERLTLAVARLPAEEEALLAALAARKFARTMNWPVSYVDIRWESFDAYLKHLAALGSNMPTKARREVAAPAKAGIRLDQDDRFQDSADEILDLMEANQRAHSAAPLGLGRDFFRTLADRHGRSCVVTLARAEETLAGAALLLTAGGYAGGSLIGVSDDPRNRKAFTYFNLALYEPIRFCIERGLKRVYLGAGLYDMKSRRGCRELELAMFIRHRSAPGRFACRLWCAVHRRWSAKKLDRQGVRLPLAPAHR